MVRRLALLLSFAVGTAAQDQPQPEPGPVPPGIVAVGKLVITPGKGDGKEALATFVVAHGKHKAGDREGALAGYLEFLGMPGRHELPRRYLATVQQRLKSLRSEVGAMYAQATGLYRKDRSKGLTALRSLAVRYGRLPEGRAALELADTDGIREAIDAARAAAKSGDKKVAAAGLEKAVRLFPAALYRYEAKKLLIELGGPDLFEPGERVGGTKERGKAAEGDGEDEDVTIEVGDG